MKQVHVECLPDETLMKKLGVSRKQITHHTGKSRVFHKLKSISNQVAMVDEDPGSPKTSYEKELVLKTELHGMKLYKDKSNNKIIVLGGKLEDWIIKLCVSAKINLSHFGLPDKPNELHNIINQRLNKFELLIEHLLQVNNVGIIQLKSWIED